MGEGPLHVHELVRVVTYHRAPVDPAPGYTEFTFIGCYGCGVASFFPYVNFAACTEEFKAELLKTVAAANWQIQER